MAWVSEASKLPRVDKKSALWREFEAMSKRSLRDRITYGLVWNTNPCLMTNPFARLTP